MLSPIPDVLLSVSGNELQVQKIAPNLGRLLQAIETGAGYSLQPDEAAALVEARRAISEEPEAWPDTPPSGYIGFPPFLQRP